MTTIILPEYRNEKMIDFCACFAKQKKAWPFMLSQQDQTLITDDAKLSTLKKTARHFRLPLFIVAHRTSAPVTSTEPETKASDAALILRLCMEIQRFISAAGGDDRKSYFFFRSRAEMSVIRQMIPEILEAAVSGGTVFLMPVCRLSRIGADNAVYEWLQARAEISGRIREKNFSYRD